MCLKVQFKDDVYTLLKQKGVFPYHWFDSTEKLYETALPPQTVFDSQLRNEACSDDEYQRAQKVWEAFNFSEFSEYLGLYLAGISQSFL